MDSTPNTKLNKKYWLELMNFQKKILFIEKLYFIRIFFIYLKRHYQLRGEIIYPLKQPF